MEGEERSIDLYTKDVIFSSCSLSGLARLSFYLDKKKVERKHQNLVWLELF